MILMQSEDIMTLVDLWSERGWLRPLDRAFVRFMRELVPGIPALVLLAGALTSHQLGRGHLCLDLSAALADPDANLSLPPEGESGEAMPPKPSQILSENSGISRDMWEKALLEYPDLVVTGSGNTPLVLDNGRLYLRRYWQYTIEVAENILKRLERSFSLPDNLSQRVDELFSHLRSEDEQNKSAVHLQSVATAVAAKSAFTIISGGPGTGKTTTVVQILALLQSLALEQGQKLRIHLAAPTGKAAARLTESIGSAVGRLPENIKEALPTKVTTLHKLLGSRSGTRHFIHTKRNKLYLDLLVVDEASMVDLEMMASLLAALPDRARLILLGDKDQLASVEAGSLLGDLCRNSDKYVYTDQTALWIEKYTGYRVRKSDEHKIDISNSILNYADHGVSPPPSVPSLQKRSDGTLLDQHIVVLRKSHRFGDQSGIGALARAVNCGNPEAVKRVWAKGYDDITALSIETTEDRAFANLILDSGYRSYLKVVSDGPQRVIRSNDEYIYQTASQMLTEQEKGHRQPGHLQQDNRRQKYANCQHGCKEDAASAEEQWIGDVLSAFSRFQLLTPLRKGPWGVAGLNRKVEQILHKEGLISATSGWYPGRPVMVLSNDYSLGLMNGDLGVLLPVKGALKVVFPMADRSFKKVPPSRLNDVETVYAMTVHKSQGSEFDHTALVLPDKMNPLLTRELIYTGITRAKSLFTLVTPRVNLLGEAVKRRTHRASGLGDILHCQ